MNVSTIQMDPAEARERLRDYRKDLHRRADDEYQAVASGYEALARGTPVLALSEVFAQTGVDDQGLPRLAFSRADRKEVRFEWVGRWWDSRGNVWRVRETGVGRFDWSPRKSSRWTYQLMRLEVPVPHPDRMEVPLGATAIVPMIPASVRKEHKAYRDRERFILWEVEDGGWSIDRTPPVVSGDPFLLEHLGGDLYAVLAEWELTALERAVLRGRRG